MLSSLLLRRCGARRLVAVFACALLLMSGGPGAQAQSGRRPPKPPKSPDPLPPKQEEPPIKTSSEQDAKPQVLVKVARSTHDISIPSYYSQLVEEGCLERLSHSVAKASSAGDLNRKQASDIAKGSPDTYALWFELKIDPVDAQRGNWQAQYFEVWYEVFTAGTGKSKTSGHVYQRPQGPGRIPVPGPGTPASAEYSLRYAGSEMADRLLDTLNLPHPSDRH